MDKLMLKKSPHSPAHLLLDQAVYFITSAIYQKRPLLKPETVKQHLLDTIQTCMTEKNWQLDHWVILDNHYHLMLTSKKGDDMPGIFRKIHGLSARFIQAQGPCELPVWWNYWDYCPRDEKDYFIRLNYLLNNPLKHGYVTNLADYPHSSFHSTLETLGRNALAKQFTQYSEYKNLRLEED
ncbi:REP-associated tyrosine transposase [Methylomonas lenta]|nr:transposase [Methylomonas lenta]